MSARDADSRGGCNPRPRLRQLRRVLDRTCAQRHHAGQPPPLVDTQLQQPLRAGEGASSAPSYSTSVVPVSASRSPSVQSTNKSPARGFAAMLPSVEEDVADEVRAFVDFAAQRLRGEAALGEDA